MTELDVGLQPAPTASTDLLCSIVVPVYRNQESIHDLIAALTWISGELDGGLEAVFVVDGSPDDSLAELRRALPGVPFRSQLIAHSRNFGAFAAIRTGFLAARGAVHRRDGSRPAGADRAHQGVLRRAGHRPLRRASWGRGRRETIRD